MNDTYVSCAVCGFKGKDIRYHIERCHGLTSDTYKEKYNSAIVSESVLIKRKTTSLEKYGEDHYTNRPAATFSFQGYEGGHPLKDEVVKKKIMETKKEIYGDPTFTNREKAKKTNLKKYGVEHTCAAPLVVEKRIKTLKERYGKVFNVSEPPNKTNIPETFKEDYYKGITVFELSTAYGVSEPVISRWIKDKGFSRTYVDKAIKNVQTPIEVVSEYFKECLVQNKMLSFYEYGKIRGSNYTLKMKRLFNVGKKFSHLKETLFIVALDANRSNEFLNRLSL